MAEIPDEHVPHEQEHTENIKKIKQHALNEARIRTGASKLVDEQMRRTSTHAAISDVSDLSEIDALDAPSSSYVEAEARASVNKINEILDTINDPQIRDTINDILAVLRDAELIPPSE